jgi:ABC-type sugar transport system ATPase subunit
MAGLNLKGLKKSYGAVDVIHGVDLEIGRASSSSLSVLPAAASQRCSG